MKKCAGQAQADLMMMLLDLPSGILFEIGDHLDGGYEAYFGEDREYIGYIGDFRSMKSFEEMIEACRRLRHEFCEYLWKKYQTEF